IHVTEEIADNELKMSELGNFVKNKLGKIIVLYDEDERLAPAAATTFVQREVDNVFMLSGGLKVLCKKFPEGLLTGQVPQSCWPTPPPSRKSSGKADSANRPRPPPAGAADQKWFYPEDLMKLEGKLDDELLSQDSRQSSRMSSRSGVSSASRASTAASTATSRSNKPVWK
ncbi:centrosomal protein of 41 kDa-like, partial [Oculina patagonica]